MPSSCVVVVSVCVVHARTLCWPLLLPAVACCKLTASSQTLLRLGFTQHRLQFDRASRQPGRAGRPFSLTRASTEGPSTACPILPGVCPPCAVHGRRPWLHGCPRSSPLASACRQHPASGVHCAARAMLCGGMTAADLIRKEWKPIIPRGLTWDEHRAVLSRVWARYVQTWRDNFNHNTTATAPADKTDAADLGTAARDLAGKYFKPQTKEGVREAVDEVRVLSWELRGGTCLRLHAVGATRVRLRC
jgi:hypothetical protein